MEVCLEWGEGEGRLRKWCCNTRVSTDLQSPEAENPCPKNHNTAMLALDTSSVVVS